ncbi:ExbD/TolR family protein [Pedobacter metabolipauper]|uniref:Outer membrane transport energization protein ExbD n=1 Tax=Pedobacter metabolipauper TaxID=425513 RepID=A0A4R6SVC2_9SPHI|nr:biopolymer transporter ExbD [Pedobacter metabolipauper]TDQ09798.1 outer membrane transport energization protein ExbD [Pedobacter metabolipauper]
MAELDTSSGGGGKKGKVRSKKANTKVDLTAMVDLAFLLITFFMLTTSLSKPIAMDIAKPDDKDPEVKTEVRASEAMTILLGKDNKIAWYMGEAIKAQPTIESFSEIRKSILKNKNDLMKSRGRQLIIIIKPTEASKYKNFVDIMDELNIAGIKTAPAIDDKYITDGEKAFMRTGGIL